MKKSKRKEIEENEIAVFLTKHEMIVLKSLIDTIQEERADLLSSLDKASRRELSKFKPYEDSASKKLKAALFNLAKFEVQECNNGRN